LYWTCFPLGVGGWAPDAAPTFELPDVPLISIYPEAGRLTLTGCDGYQEAYRDIRFTHNWSWQSGEAPTMVPPAPEGAASFRAAGEQGWSAIAYPDSHIVGLQSDDGRNARLTCYYPFRLAWSGPSLIVSTLYGELLRFPDLGRAFESVFRG
jgi:hypothetical protein